jgi:hypothetical protein
MLTLSVDELEYNQILHDLLKLSLIMIHIKKQDDELAMKAGMDLLANVRERMLEIIANSD